MDPVEVSLGGPDDLHAGRRPRATAWDQGPARRRKRSFPGCGRGANATPSRPGAAARPCEPPRSRSASRPRVEPDDGGRRAVAPALPPGYQPQRSSAGIPVVGRRFRPPRHGLRSPGASPATGAEPTRARTRTPDDSPERSATRPGGVESPAAFRSVRSVRSMLGLIRRAGPPPSRWLMCSPRSTSDVGPRARMSVTPLGSTRRSRGPSARPSARRSSARPGHDPRPIYSAQVRRSPPD